MLLPLVGFVRPELLDGGEDDAAGRNAEELAEVFAVFGLDGWLKQGFVAAGEGAEELVVEIIAIGEDDDGGVAQAEV